MPAADGSLNVEQNWTRVGTDQVDQLFDQAVATLDDSERRDLIRKADSRIWAAVTHPALPAPAARRGPRDPRQRRRLRLRHPVYEDMGFLKKSAQGPQGSPGAKDDASAAED